MNTHDADIVRRDSALPGLGLLLDEKDLLAALQTLPALREARDLRITYLRYKPATSCVAGVAITCENGEIRRYFAKALTVERFRQSWLHPKRQALIAAGDACAPMALADKAIMLQSPGADRAIRYLTLLEGEKRLNLLRELLPDLPEPHSVTWRFLRYKPERRAVVALSLRGKPFGVLRVASKSEYGGILQGSAVGAALGHISLTACKGDSRMLMTGWIAGQSLGPEHGGSLASSDMLMAGIALARLHQTPFSLPVIRRVEDDLQAMWRVFTSLASVFPAGVTQFQQLAQRIAHFFAGHEGQITLIHGDFSADQLIKPDDGGSLRIIDWDRCVCGNPLADLASFRARLEIQAIGGMISTDRLHEAMQAFLTGYGSQREVDSGELLWYSGWALLCLAAEPFRRRANDWPRQTERLLARVSQLIRDAENYDRKEKGLDQRIAALCDAEQTGPALIAALALPAGQPLPDCRLLRHKPGRRALVEYTLPSFGCVLGKYRYKGVDNHGYQCQLALWRHGFREPQRVEVPRPLAVLPERHLWLQEKRQADSLTDALFPANPELARLGSQVGQALAAIQQCDSLTVVAAAKRWHIADELAVLAKGLDRVAVQYPHWQSRLVALLADCTALTQTLTTATSGCTHRDFYPDQVMVSRDDAGQLVMLDFDLCCLSFPALDVGNYLAHVRELALRRYQDCTALAQHEEAFIGAWLAQTPDESPEVIGKFITLSLARHIFLSTRFAERRHTTTALLEECERQLRHWLGEEEREITRSNRQ